MSEEKVESSEEDKKVLDADKQEEQKSEEEDGFVKDNETVAANKYNQAIRKQREIELEKRELEKKLALAENGTKAEEKEEKEEEEDPFKDEEEDKSEKVDHSKLINEALKPVMETLKKREENDRKIARTAFFEAHPEYLNDSEKFHELLDEMDASLNPNSQDDYYTQLEKTHRILSGDPDNSVVEDKKKEMAADAAGSDGAEKASVKEEFTADDRRIMKEQNVSADAMRALKKKLADGSMRLL